MADFESFECCGGKKLNGSYVDKVEYAAKMQTSLIVVLLLLQLVIVGGGIFLTSYLKKKAQNLATREEFKELQRQTAELTRTTAQIESEIKGDLWDRQKQWELKRDVMFEAAKAMGAVKDTLAKMHGIYMTDKQSAAQGKPIRADKQGEVYAAFNKAADKLDQAFMLVAIACGDDVRNKVGEFGVFTRELGVEIANGKPENFTEQADEFATRWTDAAKAIRSEMGSKKKA